MKYFFYCLILLILILLQIGFVPRVKVLSYLDLPICFLIIYFFSRKKFIWFYFLIVAVFLDLYSILPTGFYLINFLLLFIFLNWMSHLVTDVGTISQLLTTIIILLSYCLITLGLNLLAYYFKLTSLPLIIDRFYVWRSLFFVVINTIIIFVFTRLCLTRFKQKPIV